jgi:hypothetical protein
MKQEREDGQARQEHRRHQSTFKRKQSRRFAQFSCIRRRRRLPRRRPPPPPPRRWEGKKGTLSHIDKYHKKRSEASISNTQRQIRSNQDDAPFTLRTHYRVLFSLPFSPSLSAAVHTVHPRLGSQNSTGYSLSSTELLNQDDGIDDTAATSSTATTGIVNSCNDFDTTNRVKG